MTASSHRVYFALWPTADTRAELAAAAAPLAAASGGRPVLASDLHLTLAFVGAVAPALLGTLARLAASIAWPSVALRFVCAEGWSAARALVLLAPTPPPALIEARAGLCARLAALGVATDPRPFRPHVTIARDVPGAPAPVPADVRWTATQVALVESEPAPATARYRPLAIWTGHDADTAFQAI